MKLVGPGLRDDGYVRARVAPVLGGEIRRKNPKLLHGVRRRKVHAGVARGIVEVGTVEGEQIHVGTASIHVHLGAAARA